MTARELSPILLQAFSAAGAEQGIAYVSVAITSGERETVAMADVQEFDRDRFRSEHSERCRRIQEENEAEAAAVITEVREHFPYVVVVAPTSLTVEGWTQADYGDFWDLVIERFAVRVVLGPRWEFSRGARREVNTAIRLGIPVLSSTGRALPATELIDLDRQAQEHLLSAGWPAERVADYLSPTIVEGVIGAQNASTVVEIDRQAAEVFAWLRGERRYQVQKFGTAADDEHTLSGLGEQEWWWRQLMNYYHRARVLGLELPNGRQALAKFVATGCGLLESAIRLYGPLPAPGVTSGENLETTVRPPPFPK